MNEPVASLNNKKLNNTIGNDAHHPQVLTDPKLPPIILDKLPTKLRIISYKDNYKPIGCVGSGSFGTVDLCKRISPTTINYPNTMVDSSIVTPHDNFYNSQNKLVAVKTMNSRLNELSSYSRVRELKFIFNVKAHKNLLRVFECFIDAIEGSIELVFYITCFLNGITTCEISVFHRFRKFIDLLVQP